MNMRNFFGYGLVSRYILRSMGGPFVFAFITIIFLLLLQFLMKFFDQLIGKGLSAWIILEVIMVNLAWIVVLAGPMSVLVATLMAFGDLSSRNEITAMKAGGMSIYRMMGPVVIAAVIVAGLLAGFYNYVLPEANHRARTLTMDIRRTKPTLNLQPGIFVKDVQGYSIMVRETSEESNDLKGITIYDFTNPNVNAVITADHGSVSFSADFRTLIMDLDEGEIHELSLQDMSTYRRLRFARHRISMKVEGFEFERTTEGTIARGDRELSAETMLAIIDSLERDATRIRENVSDLVRRDMLMLFTGRPDTTRPMSGLYLPPMAPVPPIVRTRQMSTIMATETSRLSFLETQINAYMVEVQKKISIPAASIVFVFIGAPLGIMARRGGFGIGATLSLGFFVIYWAFLIGGEKLADRNILSPVLGMWSANILLGLLGILLTVRIGREAIVIRFEALRRFIPRSLRPDPSGNSTQGDVT